MSLMLRVFICLQLGLTGLPLIVGYVEERLTTEGDRVSLYCHVNNSTAESSVQWLYTPGEAYQGVQHIYIDGRMLSRWRSRCHVTTNATSSTLVLHSVHPKDTGYYECSDDRDDEIVIQLRVKLTVSRLSALYSTAKLFDKTTVWDKNETITEGNPDSHRLVSGETSIYLANLNAFMMIGGIILVITVVAIMLAALATVALKKQLQRRNKKARSAQGELDNYAEIQTTPRNAEQGNIWGSDNNARQVISSRYEYEEIPTTVSTVRVEYDTSSGRDHYRNVNPLQNYEEIPATTIQEEHEIVNGAVSLFNDRINVYLQPLNDVSSMNFEEMSHMYMSLPGITPGPLNVQEDGQEGVYWPMVRDGYVVSSIRPNISEVVYAVLHPKKESQQKRKARLRMFRFFRRKSVER